MQAFRVTLKSATNTRETLKQENLNCPTGKKATAQWQMKKLGTMASTEELVLPTLPRRSASIARTSALRRLLWGHDKLKDMYILDTSHVGCFRFDSDSIMRRSKTSGCPREEQTSNVALAHNGYPLHSRLMLRRLPHVSKIDCFRSHQHEASHNSAAHGQVQLKVQFNNRGEELARSLMVQT